MKLSDISVGQKATISRIDSKNRMICRLADMGMREQSCVVCLFKSLSGGIRAYRVGEYVIALRREDAACINVFL